MKQSFKQFFLNRISLNEKKFASADFNKHDYLERVIKDLVAGKPVYLGATKNDKQFIQLDTEKNTDIIEKLSNVKTINDFNTALKPVGVKWTDIFKGIYSGYTNGLATKNKGNAFEAEIIEALSDEESEIYKEVIKAFKIKSIASANAVGSANTRRPLSFSGDSILVGGTTGNIGKDISDITITDEKGKEYYISAKYGNHVTFVNTGIKKLFPEEFFTDDSSKLSNEAKTLLDMFGIDKTKFKKVFTSYDKNKSTKKGPKEKVKIKNKLASNAAFNDFVKSCIGYGYVMIHKSSNSDIDVIDLRTEAARDEFINKITDATILYPLDGSAKRIDIKVSYPNIDFEFNIRPKDVGVYPTHLMADYQFK